MKFAFYTLGCKVNQYETQAMEQRLRALGHSLGDWTEPCDGFIINTCTVTAVSDKKSRNVIRRVRRLNPDAVVGVCGCYAQTSPAAVRRLEVDVLAGTADRMAFLEAVVDEATRRVREKRDFWERAADHRDFEVLPAGGLAARTRARATSAAEARPSTRSAPSGLTSGTRHSVVRRKRLRAGMP